MRTTVSHPKLYIQALPDEHFSDMIEDIGIIDPEGGVVDIILFKYINEYEETGVESFNLVFQQVYPWNKRYKNLNKQEAVFNFAENIYKDQFRGFPIIQPIKFLIKLNEIEYEKLEKHIVLIENKKKNLGKNDHIEMRALEEIIKRLENFKIKFIDWFYTRDSKLPQIKLTPSKIIRLTETDERTIDNYRPTVDLINLIPSKVQWGQIEINILTDYTIKIIIPQDSFEINCSQTKYFMNKKTKQPNDSWELLLELSYLGYFHPKEYSYKYLIKKTGKPKNRVYVLGKLLIKEFGIQEKPFLKYERGVGWYPIFKISDQRDNLRPRDRIKKIYNIQKSKKKNRKSENIPQMGNTYHSEDNLNFDEIRQEDMKRKGLNDGLDDYEKTRFEEEIEH